MDRLIDRARNDMKSVEGPLNTNTTTTTTGWLQSTNIENPAHLHEVSVYVQTSYEKKFNCRLLNIYNACR